jgi:hypothetical protein
MIGCIIVIPDSNFNSELGALYIEETESLLVLCIPRFEDDIKRELRKF